MGQKPPGITPEIFAPGIISTEASEFACTFTPDGKEFYFTRRNAPDNAENPGLYNTIYSTSLQINGWTIPEKISYTSNQGDLEPFISPDGNLLLFGSEREKPQNDKREGGIWYLEKINNKEWSKPEYCDFSINDGFAMYSTISKSGNIYYTGFFNENFGIFLIKKNSDSYSAPVYVSENINSLPGAAHSFIAPDESYIVFDSQPKGNAKTSLYISFADENGNWSIPIKFDKEINATETEMCAYVSPDGKYLFFCLNRDIWWVSTEIIDQLRPATGEIAYAITPSDGNSELFLINADGSGKTQLTNQPGRPYGPAFSTDATKIAFYNHLSDQTWSLYLMNADGSNIQRLTNATNTLDWSPDWSPEGSKIVFARSYATPVWRSEIWLINPDGSNLHRLGNQDGQGPDWSPDGSKITYFNYVEGGGDIWIANADGSNPIKLTDHPAEDWWPKLSPDGSKIAFQSKRYGNHEIYVMNSDGSNPTRLTNNSADDEDPNWSPDGTKIAFISMRDGHYEIYTMNADGSNQTRITTTNGHAIDPDWKPIANPTSVKESRQSFNSLPEKFELFQNYPNPFNSSTTIRYHLSQPVKLRLQIFDIMGRLVHTLIDNQQQAGDYQISWDGTDKKGLKASTGVYLCQLTADRYSCTNKLLLIK